MLMQLLRNKNISKWRKKQDGKDNGVYAPDNWFAP